MKNKNLAYQDQFVTFIEFRTDFEGHTNNNAKIATDQNEFIKYFREKHSIIGMTDILRQLFLKYQIMRGENRRKSCGLKISNSSHHTVFLGSPGTGKTKMAHILAEFYCSLGILKEPKPMIIDRGKIIKRYIGETDEEMESLIKQAVETSSLIFFDEAYSLVSGDEDSRDFGRNVIDILNQRMEEHRYELIVVVAGYEHEMRKFFNANSGLKSRFSSTFHFPDYQPGDLLKIFYLKCLDEDYSISLEASRSLFFTLVDCYNSRTKTFGNARLVEKIFDAVVNTQYKRHNSLEDKGKTITMEECKTFEIEDFVSIDLHAITSDTQNCLYKEKPIQVEENESDSGQAFSRGFPTSNINELETHKTVLTNKVHLFNKVLKQVLSFTLIVLILTGLGISVLRFSGHSNKDSNGIMDYNSISQKLNANNDTSCIKLANSANHKNSFILQKRGKSFALVSFQKEGKQANIFPYNLKKESSVHWTSDWLINRIVEITGRCEP